MLDDFTWSFSKLSAYAQCPRSFFLQYIDRVPQEGNAFSEYGTFCHALMEKWAKGELLAFELADAYSGGYNDAVKHYFPAFPPGIGLSYYKGGLRYFNTFEGFGDDYEIIAAEERFDVLLQGIRMTGIIDLLLRSKSTGELVVMCHKSKSLKSMKNGFDVAVRQLYLYAAGVNLRYGQYPSLLRFNLFRSGRYMDELFCRNRFGDTAAWLTGAVGAIKADTVWKPNPSEYHCTQICSCFAYCEVAQDVLMQRGGDSSVC